MEFDGEEEIELSLGLGIGGCRKRERTEDRVNEAAAGAEVEEEMDLVKRKKEMQALRRSEARRKREEKKRMKTVRNNSMSIHPPEDGGDERRERTEVMKSDAGEDTEQSASAYAFPIYSYPSYQYVPFANGFAIPCIAPVYTAETVASSKIVANQTVSFRPFHGGNKTNTVNEVNGSNDEGSIKPVSNGSVGCCSSAVSENRSISSPDGSSSDSASHSSRPGSTKTEQHSSCGSDVPGASNATAFANPSIISNLKNSNKSPLTDLPQPNSEKVVKESTNVGVSRTSVTKDNNVDNNSSGKPPRPRQADNQKPSSPLSEMPCVSTTGNGPDGKTITGFLYRYTTTAEVSIVCVCHGESFSPAEFVKHAGAIDIAHPLRHITVVPSAF